MNLRVFKVFRDLRDLKDFKDLKELRVVDESVLNSCLKLNVFNKK